MFEREQHQPATCIQFFKCKASNLMADYYFSRLTLPLTVALPNTRWKASFTGSTFTALLDATIISISPPESKKSKNLQDYHITIVCSFYNSLRNWQIVSCIIATSLVNDLQLIESATLYSWKNCILYPWTTLLMPHHKRSAIPMPTKQRKINETLKLPHADSP